MRNDLQEPKPAHHLIGGKSFWKDRQSESANDVMDEIRNIVQTAPEGKLSEFLQLNDTYEQVNKG